jgi:hypothetical protein
MSSAAQFVTQHLAAQPRGWKVRSKRVSRHVLRFAFPPGRRRRGSGKILEILHPKKNPACEEGSCDVRQKAANNPAELLIFGNPGVRAGITAYKTYRSRGAKRGAALREAVKHAIGKKRNAGTAKHKANCRCPICKHARSNTGRGSRITKRVRRRNAAETEQAVRLFEAFHGKDASKIAEKQVSAALRKDYTALGNLIYLKVLTPVGQAAAFHFEDDGVTLASSPDGKQLYCIGGRQNLLPLLDEASSQKDFIDLGECLEVAYLARKIHSNYEPVEWFHKFGERAGSTRPQLMFDKLKKQIFFVGGEYSIDPNVDVSPGIEN